LGRRAYATIATRIALAFIRMTETLAWAGQHPIDYTSRRTKSNSGLAVGGVFASYYKSRDFYGGKDA
jgi:hypothetical protein